MIVDRFVQVRISIEKLATTIMKLAHMSKEADKIVKSAREWESKTLNNEVEIEELDKQMREARRIGKHPAFFRDSLTRVASLVFLELSFLEYTVKKGFSIFPSPAEMSLTKLSLGGNNLYMTSLFLPRESLVSGIPAGDGKIEKLFLRCICRTAREKVICCGANAGRHGANYFEMLNEVET